MIRYYFPVILVVMTNAVYHICAKGIPKQLNPMISIMVTYLIGASFAAAIFFLTDPTKDAAAQIRLVNWAPILLGFVLVGLELGFIMLYRVGWDISIGSLVCNIALAVLMIVIGYFFYKEHLSLNQFIGITLCIVGLIFVNKK
ncbi:MAG: EamA family transporter [Eubacteriales bacterium]|nr:EamA family transporter [Eubacteriales bacterium]